MQSLSVVIITYNEEKNIARCLNSVKDIADEIVIVDSFSTDNTKEVCKEYGVRFIEHTFEGYIEQKNRARMQAKHDYVLSLDADEALSDELIKNIKSLRKQGFTKDGYTFNRLTNYCGKWVRHTGWYPDVKLRLWHKEKGQWEGMNPHDKFQMKPGSSVSHVKGDMLHYSYHSMNQHLTQMVTFAQISAESKFRKGKKTSLFLLLIRPWFIFIKKYFLKKGFLDGYYGFVISVLTAYGTFQKDILLREMHKQATK
ncbi:MAG: glycosyltransferase [Bacteroidetes bacterium]|jgi:glycosyltransferase involved in cell wall biosynthesis|nr:glycosyltransferase [Bacteroidota bacterium]